MKKVNRIDQIGKPRFRIAVHALVWIAQSGCVLSSKAIAERVHSHPTFLRRVLATLCQSGILKAKEGREGGYCLIKCVEDILLSDVYFAIKKQECEEAKKQMLEDCDAVSQQLDQKLEEIMIVAEDQIVDYLKQFTLADIMNEIHF